MINETRHCFHAAEALKIHKPEIKRKGLSPESFRNTLARAGGGLARAGRRALQLHLLEGNSFIYDISK